MNSDVPLNAFDTAGRKTGRWSEPDPHGGTMTGEYVDGDRVGHWCHVAGDGRLRSEGDYVRGELHGAWTWYRASGLLRQSGAFDQGAKDGAWERWDAQGNLLDTTWWKQGRRHRPKA